MLQELEPFQPPSISSLHSIDDVIMWIACSMCRICPPVVAKRVFSENWPLYGELTLLLGKMLDV